MTGLYSMLIGFIVGAIIGKFIAPTVLECMLYIEGQRRHEIRRVLSQES